MLHDGQIFQHVEVSDLPISYELSCAIQRWDDAYQETFVQQDPSNSGFGSEDLEHDHFELGLSLASELQQELGDDFIVSYERL